MEPSSSRPKAVGATLRVVRLKRRAPSSSSSSETALETVGCETPRLRAASLKEPASATAFAYSSWTRFMVHMQWL